MDAENFGKALGEAGFGEPAFGGEFVGGAAGRVDEEGVEGLGCVIWEPVEDELCGGIVEVCVGEVAADVEDAGAAEAEVGDERGVGEGSEFLAGLRADFDGRVEREA